MENFAIPTKLTVISYSINKFICIYVYESFADGTYCLNWTQLEALLDTVAKNPKTYLEKNLTANPLWDAFGSFFFSLVIISTIGKTRLVTIAGNVQ